MDAGFIGEPVEVQFDVAPLLSKRPHCPDRFVWQATTYHVVELLREWRDYERRGRMADNMQPAHSALAAKRGSWGVGRFYYWVRVEDGRIFELYYDRAPQDADRRQGSWILKQEIAVE